MFAKPVPIRWLGTVAAWGVCCGLLSAQESKDIPGQSDPPRILQQLTAEQLQQVMKPLEYETVVRSPELLLWKIHTVKTALLLRNNGRGLQFFAYYKGGGVSLKQINRWNRTRRFSRSFLDEKGNPCLKLDLDLRGGITRKQLEIFLKTCETSFLVWAKEVIKPARDAARGKPPAT